MNDQLKKGRAIALIAVVAMVGMLLAPVAAFGHSGSLSTASDHCSSSTFCYWENVSWSGCFRSENGSDSTLVDDQSEAIPNHDSCGFSWNDDIDSIYNKESVCVFMYAEVNYQGQVEKQSAGSADSTTEIHDGISSLLYTATGSCP